MTAAGAMRPFKVPVVMRRRKAVKIRGTKRKFPGKVQKVDETACLTEDGYNFIGRGVHGPCFSYRGKWAHEGCPGTFEAWLVSNGVIWSSGARGRSDDLR